MRILVISNFYPPHYMGGYELGCRDMVDALQARGHDVTVLTSTYKVPRPTTEGSILRWMESSFEWGISSGLTYIWRIMRQEKVNQAAFRKACQQVAPDLIYFWGESFLSASLLFTAQKMNVPSCYYIFDDWLSGIENDPWLSLMTKRSEQSINRLGKALLLPILGAAGYLGSFEPLRCEHVQFASEYLKQRAIDVPLPVQNAEIIPWGIDAELFPYRSQTRQPRKLLFVGQVLEHKGAHTAVEALALLRARPEFSDITLTIAGGTSHTDYGERLRALVSSLGLSDVVTFAGKVPREMLPAVYHEHDIFVFPSVFAEPFGITPLEAMASGLAVVATPTGGSREKFKDGENALLFDAEDAAGCADMLSRLLSDTALYERIRAAGRAAIENQFAFTHVVDRVESGLQRILPLERAKSL